MSLFPDPRRKGCSHRIRAPWTMLVIVACVQFCLGASFPNGVLRARSQLKHRDSCRTMGPSTPVLCMKERGQNLPRWSPPYVLPHVRGGAVLKASSSEAADSPARRQKRTVALWIVGISAVAYFTVDNWAAIATFFDKDHLQARILKLLHSVEEQGAYGVVLYTLGMAFWEMLGMSTIPVETAAGMAFGFRRAFIASAFGKVLGAVSAYVLGKSVLSDFVRAKLQHNKVLKLVDGSVQTHPFRTAILLRYSVFPEFVKNAGASLFSPLRPWMFVLSVALHGWLYTAVWTYLGVDAARRLEEPHVPVDRLLKFCVTMATFVGMVLTPLIMAWWIRDMQESQLNTIDPEDK